MEYVWGHGKDDHPTHPLSFKRKPGGLGPEPLGRRGRGTSSGETLLSVEKKKKKRERERVCV